MTKDDFEESGGELTTAEYDKSLKDSLLQHGFDCENILDLCRTGLLSCKIRRDRILVAVESFQKEHKTGCIFMLPSNRRDNSCYVYYSPMSSDEIRRTLALKAFL